MYNSRTIDRNLYALNKMYGEKNTLLQVFQSAVTDYDTGEEVVTYVDHYINQAVILPSVLTNTAMALLSGIFQQGGEWDKDKRLMIVREKYMPKGYNSNTKDVVTVGGTVYNIDKVETEYSYLFTLKVCR